MIIKTKNARQIWKRLKDSIVPIVTNDEYNKIDEVVKLINDQLSGNKYIPDVGHGYLGFPKNNGCTRFVPILTKEDMTVYYSLVLSLQKFLVKPKPGIYGAWQIVPERVKSSFEVSEEDAIVEPYYSETLSKKAWFKNWKSLNDLIEATCGDRSVGDFVITSDIANFYDTIDIGRLITNIRSDVTGESNLISLLDHFLQYWDRRLKGYAPSSKGIPQEIISDASRILANYYLDEFDDKFSLYCKSNGITFIRWADDIFLFGKSYKQLENAIHKASKLLLGIGLNLSAAKTKKFTKKQFVQYRCIPLLQAISENNSNKFLRELKKLDKYNTKNEARIDTAIKASLNILDKNSAARQNFSLNFIDQKMENYEYLSLLTEAHLLKRYKISEHDALKKFRQDLQKIVSKPYAAPKSSFLKLIKKYHVQLNKLGISNLVLKNAVKKIEDSSADSELIKVVCVASAKAEL